MKVQDIRSFFGKPGGSKASSSRDPDDEEKVVEIPSRLKKGGSKKSKKDDRLNISVSATDEDDDKEDPLPQNIRKKAEDKNGKAGKKKKKAVIVDDSDDEEPLPKSVRGKVQEKEERKRKARVLSDSDEDDFKHKEAKKSPKQKPVAKQAKVEARKDEEKKTVNPTDFFSTAPVKRETKQKNVEVVEPPKKNSPEKRLPKSKSPIPEKTESKPSKSKEAEKVMTRNTTTSALKTPPKTRSHDGSKESSPHRPPTSIIEPKKLKMETPTPEKRKVKTDNEKSAATSSPKSKRTPEKDKVFKVPTPAAVEKSKSRVKAEPSNSKRSAPIDEDDDEEDFNPKKKAAKNESTPTRKGKASSKKGDKTPSKDEGDGSGKKRELTDKQKENFKKFLAKQTMKPKNLGSKIIPIGASDCLQGFTFVISGILDSLEREDCKELVEKYGGRVTGSVSRKTSYLIVGDEAGESKTKKANELKVPIIDEDGFLEIIRKSNPNGTESQDSGLAGFESDMNSEPMKVEIDADSDAEKSLFSSPVSSKGSPSKRSKLESPEKKQKEKVADRQKKVGNKNDVKPLISTISPTPPPAGKVVGETEPMWVDKYRPKTLRTVVGQSSDTSNAKKLLKWLQNWFKYHGSADDKAKAAWPGLRDPEGKTFKAALLSGPPGVGKTTTAHLAVKEVGYDYYELNASDTRNKKGLHQNVSDALTNKTIVFGRPNDEGMTRKHVLIMDEVDGMSGNEDRGGVQELIALIKSSRVPVICICNDRNHPKIRSLSNYCFDLRFNKPSFEQLRGFISSICFKEKIKIPQDKVHQLIISTDNDVRQILHQLELFKEGKSDQAFNPRKDLKFGPWDVIRKVFLKSEHEKMSIHDKTGLFFQDYNIGPLFVQENYLRWVPAKAQGCKFKYLDLLANTASSLANGDLVETVIRRSQSWGLLPVQAVFASYIPGEYMAANNIGGVEFPSWLGKNSNKNKRHRLLQTLHTHLHLQVSGSLEALNMDYLPYLRRTITNPLVAGDIDAAAEVMENYTLLRDDVESITDLSLWPGTKDPMEKVESKTKAAFTRKINKELMLPYASGAKPVKGKGRRGGGDADDGLEALLEEGEFIVDEEEEEEETIEKDAMVKVKTRKTAAATSSRSKASSSTSGRGGKKGKK